MAREFPLVPGLATLLLLVACGGDGGSGGFRSSQVPVVGRQCVEGLTFFGDATRHHYDYTPSTAPKVALLSSLVVRAHAVSVHAAEGDVSLPAGTTDLTTQFFALFELTIDDVYKGELTKGQHIVVRLPRDGNVIPEHLVALSKSPPSIAVTLFLADDPAPAVAASSSKSLPAYVLPSPQGLIVAAQYCESQPLASEPLFEQGPLFEGDLDEAVREAVRAP